MKVRRVAAVIVAALLPLGPARSGRGAETDNFTHRFLSLEDSAPKLNKMVNAALVDIAKQANGRLQALRSDPRGLDDTQVELTFVQTYRDVVLRRFDDRVLPFFEGCIERNDCPGWPTFERIALWRAESIYGESNYNGVAISFLAPSIDLCGVRIGTDKMTHLFSNGFFYYNESRQKRSHLSGEPDIYRLALADERGLMGARSTAVISPADAEASVAGYKLARDYFAGEDPVFARDEQTGLLVKRRPIDVCAYVSPQWDEALNPSVFTASRARVKRVRAAIHERLAANSRAEASMSAAEKEAFKEEVVRRRLDPAHGKLSLPYKLYLALKYTVAYLTIPEESRQGIRSIMFPKLKLKDRRPIFLKPAGGGSGDAGTR